MLANAIHSRSNVQRIVLSRKWLLPYGIGVSQALTEIDRLGLS